MAWKAQSILVPTACGSMGRSGAVGHSEWFEAIWRLRI